ncbi:MAG: DUF507 family protein [Deltaproteobacteria bacterium]|nr:DUF507 family protein [Deltaproteobacteria bacterium]
MSRASDGRISALAHLALDALKKGDEVADLRTDRLVLAEIKAVLTDFFDVDEAIDAKVRRKIGSLSRRVPEGSSEWNVLYRQYLEEEKRKLGR